MNSIGSTVRQSLRAFQIIQRSRRLTSSFLVGIWLLVIVFAGLSYFISGDQTQLVRVKFFSYALISLQKVNDLLLMDEILPSPNSFIFKGRYRKGLLVQGSAALSVMQANRSLLSSVEDRDLQAVLLTYTLMELPDQFPDKFNLSVHVIFARLLSPKKPPLQPYPWFRGGSSHSCFDGGLDMVVRVK